MVMPDAPRSDEVSRAARPKLRVRVREAWRRFWKRVPPGPRARRAGTFAVAALAAILAAFSGSFVRPGFPGLLDPLSGSVAGLVYVGLVFLASFLGLKLLFALPRFVTSGALAFGITVVFVLGLFGLPEPVRVPIAAALTVLELVLAASVAALARGFGALKPWRKAVTPALLALTLAANAAIVVFLASPGSSADPYPPEESPVALPVRPLDLPDPSLPGTFRVLSLTYGSGTDRRRPEFGAAAALRTQPVDASAFVEHPKGWRGSARRAYWGFDAKAFPLNGRVWHPEGPGPFPLVLMVHGNHKMEDFSDPGYEYLGRLLASRGTVAVSVDENFFNGSFLTGLGGENDGRGWLLLKHLEAWRRWNAEPGNPFEGRVDLARIALVGHSRGGEAAAVAAVFNRLSRYPDDATVAFGFGFGIRAVVAIAPIDGQYQPAGRPSLPSGVDYLVLQGDYDSDLSFFSGDRVYRRVAWPGAEDGFKASVYVHRANHGQFNTAWGAFDYGLPGGLFLNRGPLLPAADQRRVAQVFISAFLEASLRDAAGYRRLFQDARAGAGWLPKTVFVTRYQDASFRAVADFEEDADAATASLPGAAVSGRGLAIWREADLKFRRDGTKRNQVAVLGWRRDKAAAAAEYEIGLPERALEGWGLGIRSVLTFSLADANEEPPAPKDERNAKDRKKDAGKKAKDGKTPAAAKKHLPPDLTVELESWDGARAALPLSAVRPVPPVLKTRFTKLPNESGMFGKPWETTLQTFRLPLALFMERVPELRPDRLKAIRFVFDRGGAGAVVLDDVGFGKES